jgi:hypothetical protein
MLNIGEIQRSQLITTYGIGSIYDALDYSVIIAGLEAWNIKNTEIICEERLQKKLKVEFFRQPKVIDETPTIPGYRFPEWVFCPSCKSLRPIYKLADRKEKKCMKCSKVRKPVNYVPVRFVIACQSGHLDDFPWNWWVHRGKNCDRPKLKLSTTGKTTSLAGIKVSCENPQCHSEPRSLEGIFGKNALSGFKCKGRRPWLGPGNKEECNQTPRVLQRGSASIYYSQTESAISIPPFSERINIFLRQFEDEIRLISDDVLPVYFKAKIDRSGENFRVDDLVNFALRIKTPDDKDNPLKDLRQGEYEALCHLGTMDPKSEFAAAEGVVAAIYRNHISRLVLVHRLREVKVLTGFTRIVSEGEVAPLSKNPQNWLPAAEMKGEGIFLELNRDLLRRWIAGMSASFSQRINGLEQTRQDFLKNGDTWVEKHELTPAFILIHTLSHLLIQQLIIECGYPSSSLRERLYINDGTDGNPEMYGLLIYTATSDSEGSLGGLVRQGEESRFSAVIRNALIRATWCSNDPLCMESEGQGADAFNLAACHSCCLLPETSCEHRNRYLDRGVVIGTGESNMEGFFSEIIEE